MLPFAVSPRSNPKLGLEDAMREYAKIGFERFELLTDSCASAADPTGDPFHCVHMAASFGFEYSSIQLPPLTDALKTSVARAAAACRFGVALGCRAAIVKADSIDNYIRGGEMLLDQVEHFPIFPVLQNHAGSAISTLEDYRAVLDRLYDNRMKCTLDVGHFHSVGVTWPEAYELLAGRIQLVHINDQIGAESVTFGTGEIDLPGLFQRLVKDDYEGDMVIETAAEDKENTLQYLSEALAYVKQCAASLRLLWGRDWESDNEKR